MSVMHNAIDLQNMGADLNIIQELPWHNSLEITEIYALLHIRNPNPSDTTGGIL